MRCVAAALLERHPDRVARFEFFLQLGDDLADVAGNAAEIASYRQTRP